MGNPLPKTTHTGTIGELLVQLRLLEYGIQAAPPIKDSGNDLIAIKGEIVKFIQVKTSKSAIKRVGRLPEIYHIVAVVELCSDDGKILMDESKIYVYKKGEALHQKRDLTKEVAKELWSE